MTERRSGSTLPMAELGLCHHGSASVNDIALAIANSSSS